MNQTNSLTNSAYPVDGSESSNVALVATVVALLVGGGAEAPLVIDPGPVVRWGLPIAKLIFNLGVATALGSLVLLVSRRSRRLS